jgi:putative transcriptional regulator
MSRPERRSTLLSALPRHRSRQPIGLIEAGRYNPTLKLCLGLARATNKSLDELFWQGGES